MNNKYEWITWETSIHCLISMWDGPGTFVKNKWVKK